MQRVVKSYCKKLSPDRSIPSSDEPEEPPGLRCQSFPSTFTVSSTSSTITPRLFSFRSSFGAVRHQNHRSVLFRKKFYPKVTAKEWDNWTWQVANRIRTVDRLRSMLSLSAAEETAFQHSEFKLPFAITPYYMSLIAADSFSHPLRRSVVPTVHELIATPGETDDPLCEEDQSPVPGLVHRYPDRVLLLVHDFCSTYCRYCTRSRVVGLNSLTAGRPRLERAIRYINEHPAIRDVLLSGGDPLLLNDERLEWLLGSLRRIPHVEIVRIGTKVPAVLPQRVTPELVRMLARYHPLWMSLHFIHPEECTPEAHLACTMLADGGIPLGSQTVLLHGINDELRTMKKLLHELMKMRVRPYYLYQCDPITGSSHFRTPVAKGLAIIEGLRGHTSGYAVPTYVIDTPGGGGKVPLTQQTVVGWQSGNLLLRNYENRCFRYPDLC